MPMKKSQRRMAAKVAALKVRRMRRQQLNARPRPDRQLGDALLAALPDLVRQLNSAFSALRAIR